MHPSPVITTGQEAVSYIHSTSWLGSRPGLSRTCALLERLGHPERALKFIHIVGTNGKGSTAAMTAAILTAAGYTTGLYTSPYLHRFHERMRVDGAEITDEELAAVTQTVARHAHTMDDPPTEFELVTCIALEYYRRAGCQFVVLEAGMGGRLDSTNAIPAPEVVAITHIGLDHTQYLGDTVEAIAAEKAAVIKPGCQVVLYQQEAGVTQVVEAVCRRQGVPLRIATPKSLRLRQDTLEGQVLEWNGLPLRLPLLGEHQRHNAAVVLGIVEALRPRFPISDQAICQGLAQTRWPGRFEVLGRNPWFLVDGGHNPQCAQTVADNLRRYFPNQKAVFLLGVLEDKDYPQVCRLVAPLAAAFVTVTPPCPRALSAQDLARHLQDCPCPIHTADTIPQGVAAAQELAGPNGLVCAFGSLYITGPVRAAFGLTR